jgi:hypothetical protein
MGALTAASFLAETVSGIILGINNKISEDEKQFLVNLNCGCVIIQAIT